MAGEGTVFGLRRGHAAVQGVVDYPALRSAYVGRELGMFIHLGLETFTDVEYTDGNVAANVFAPSAMDIDQWVVAAQALGAGYACLTSKHHSGFCLWPSATTTYDIAATTWYSGGGYDIVDRFITKFRAAGIEPILYFSIQDKKFERSVNGGSEITTELQCETYRVQYKAHLEAQMREILQNYGTIAGVWADGGQWHFDDIIPSNPAYPWASSAEFIAFLRSVSPRTLLIDNNHTFSAADSDIVEYELATDVPQGNTVAAEKCMSIDAGWFWKSTGYTLKTAENILDRLNYCVQRSASLLLNLPPSTVGTIPSAYTDLAAVIKASWSATPPVTGIKVSYWLDPSDISSMKQEITGASATTAAAVDSVVGSIKNKGQVGGWLVCPDDASRPTLRSDGTYYWLEFTGSHKFSGLNRAGTDAAMSSVIGARRVSGNFTGFQANNAGPRSPDFQIFSNVIYVGGRTTLYNSAAYTETGTGRVYSSKAGLSVPSLRIDGVARSLSAGGARPFGSVADYLVSPDGGGNGSSRLYQYMTAYRDISAANLSALETFVGSKMGITI